MDNRNRLFSENNIKPDMDKVPDMNKIISLAKKCREESISLCSKIDDVIIESIENLSDKYNTDEINTIISGAMLLYQSHLLQNLSDNGFNTESIKVYYDFLTKTFKNFIK